MTSEVDSGASENVAAEGDGDTADAGPANGPQYDQDDRQDDRTVKRLRLGIGAIGLLLPPVLPFGNWVFVQLGHHTQILPPTMSGSYYTGTRNIFVGSLCALGVFLIGYRVSARQDLWATVIGVFAIAAALFPAAPTSPTDYQKVIGYAHLGCAAILLSGLSAFCLVSFRREADPNRQGTNRAYLIAGVLIPVFLLVGAISGGTGWGSGWKPTPLYACEALSVWAFGAAWLGAAIGMGDTSSSAARRAASQSAGVSSALGQPS